MSSKRGRPKADAPATPKARTRRWREKKRSGGKAATHGAAATVSLERAGSPSAAAAVGPAAAESVEDAEPQPEDSEAEPYVENRRSRE